MATGGRRKATDARRKLTSREIDEKYIKQGEALAEYIMGKRDAPPAEMLARGGGARNAESLRAAAAMRNANAAMKGFNTGRRRGRPAGGDGVEDTDDRRL